MKRSLALVAVLALSLAATDAHAQVSLDCRERAARKAASLYGLVTKQFRRCGKDAGAGGVCDAALRDARVARKLAKTRSAILRSCTDTDATGQGFANAGELAVSIAGAANGEARQVADSVYRRIPSSLAPELRDCAGAITAEAANAGKKTVKEMIACGTAPSCASVHDSLWGAAELRASNECPATALAALVGGDLGAHMREIRAGAERVAGAIRPSFHPVVSVLDPAPGEIVVPPGLPFDLDVAGFVASVPHAGYVNSFEIDGEEASFAETSEDFARTVEITRPDGANHAIFLKARTTLGTVSTNAHVNLNLGSLAPDVVITAPGTGTITNAAAIPVSGAVIGNLAEADVLLVGGVPTSFDPVTGAFSRSVPLTEDTVQFLDAEVRSIALGTENKDAIVVLKGNSWPLALRVPNAIYGRLNDSGFDDIEGIIEATIDDAFAPERFVGRPAAGGRICDLDTGAKTVQAEGVGENTVQAEISIDRFEVTVCNIPALLTECTGFYRGDVRVTTQGNLEGTSPPPGGEQHLNIGITNTSVVFSDSFSDLIGDPRCDFAEAFLEDVESAFEAELTAAFNAALPDAINAALGGIKVSEDLPLRGMTIDSFYTAVPEDSQGVTFVLSSNITANRVHGPLPDAPVITSTLLPPSPGSPVLGPTVPGSGLPYDLGFCLSDGFLNRAMAALVHQGELALSVTSVSIPGGPVVALTTDIIGAASNPYDAAYAADCPGCGVTLVLKPTVAPIVRAPEVGEDGTVMLVVPNYRIDVVVDDAGTPRTQLSALVTFTLPLALTNPGAAISLTGGTAVVNDVKVTNNPVGANQAGFTGAVETLLPENAADALGGVFQELALPPFEGLTLSGRGTGYNVRCTGLYFDLF